VSGRLRRSALAPWTGVFMGALAWFGHHQLASNAVYYDCRSGGPWLTAGLGLLAALVTVAGALISWRSRSIAPSNPDRPETRSVAGAIGAMTAAIFLVAIGFQSLSGFLIPACFR